MKRLDNILADYQNADFEKRLYLFLDCRELREEFIKIDQEETVNQTVQKVQPDTITKITEKLFDLFPASLQSKIKRCCSLQ